MGENKNFYLKRKTRNSLSGMQEIIFPLYYNMIKFSSAKTGQLVLEIFMFESVSFYKDFFFDAQGHVPPK